jgi:hypothetical protein
LIGPHRDELARRNLPTRHPSWILLFGDCSNDDVAIGDHSHEPVPVEDGYRPYVFGFHQPGGLAGGVSGAAQRGRAVITSRTFIPTAASLVE